MYKKIKPVTFNGETKSLYAWSLDTGISYSTLNKRLSLGWDIEKALTAKVEKKEKTYITIDGEIGTLHSWCQKLKLPYVEVYKAIKNYGADPGFIMRRAIEKMNNNNKNS
ncbi:MAG: hypothetical protein BWX92_01502 [Deltaproteobacteria bacterium ADurb.Bin135]|nr:MAG: hypothetical protein BWX92_01502 [Deltaproteobacteria bacterium ADurb.Bin135]HQB35255.1 hypothetical protein [Syntrophorhabdus sp.]